jgi:signal transduction histidine kinase
MELNVSTSLSSDTRSLRVLLVEDDEDDYILTRDFIDAIDDFQIKLDWVLDYEAALKALAYDKYDIYLLDHSLGAHTGLELLRSSQMQEIAAPKIMLTGLGNEALVVDVMQAGAADYLPKRALSSNSIKRVICNAVEKHDLRLAVESKRRKLERTNRELRRKNEEIQKFYHSVSHELKTPLTAMREFLSIVLDGLAGPVEDQQREYLTIAKEGCDQLTFRLNDLVDATRLDTGKLGLSPKPASIAEIMRQAVTSMALYAQKKQIRLKQRHQGKLPDVLVDNQRIMQVLTNLIGNAIKFTDNDGRVVVKASKDLSEADKIMVSVSDTGRGIEAQKCARIFDRLYQTRQSDGTRDEGLGLGLYICQQIVHLHGGEISVQSTPGKGSTFMFTLPICDELEVTSEHASKGMGPFDKPSDSLDSFTIENHIS